MNHYLLLHTAKGCIGCHACEIHCKTNKQIGSEASPCRVIRVDSADPRTRYLSRFAFLSCFHCKDAACIRACPTGAMQRRDDDGIVFINQDVCIGCKRCLLSCPWGAPQWDEATQKVIKCDYCKDRLDAGLQPACVTKCLTNCLELVKVEDLPDAQRRQQAAGRTTVWRAAEQCGERLEP